MAWVKQKSLFPVINKFTIKRIAPEAVETRHGAFYESIHTGWFDVTENGDVPHFHAEDMHSLGIGLKASVS